MGNIYAYVRVSSKDQNKDRQVLCMKELQEPEPNIFIDSGNGDNLFTLIIFRRTYGTRKANYNKRER